MLRVNWLQLLIFEFFEISKFKLWILNLEFWTFFAVLVLQNSRIATSKNYILYYAAHPPTFIFCFALFRTFLGANDAPRDWLQYVLWIGSQTKFLTKLWTFENSRVWSVCMVTLLGARFAMSKPPFDQKPTPPINFWFSEIWRKP